MLCDLLVLIESGVTGLFDVSSGVSEVLGSTLWLSSDSTDVLVTVKEGTLLSGSSVSLSIIIQRRHN